MVSRQVRLDEKMLVQFQVLTNVESSVEVIPPAIQAKVQSAKNIFLLYMGHLH